MKHCCLLLICVLFLSGCSASEKASGSAKTPEPVPTNPVATTPESIASGKKLFDKLCVECHGEKGDGHSAIAAAMKEGEVKPSNLTDDLWDHGSADGDLFVDIRDGVGGAGAMKGLNGRPGVGPTEMWNLVNYVRTLHR
jgi:mono/diheme cytochrome c family protein